MFHVSRLLFNVSLALIFCCFSAAAQDTLRVPRAPQPDRPLHSADTTITTSGLGPDTLDLGLSAPSQRETLTQRLSEILQSKGAQRMQTALLVYDLTADTVMFAYMPDALMRPASCQKLVTSIGALYALGGNYNLRTTFLARPAVADSGKVLRGNVYVRAGFDPLLGLSEVRSFVNELKALGVDTLRGDLVIDLSMKDDSHWGAGWCWDDGNDTNPDLSPLQYKDQGTFENAFAAEMKRAGIFWQGGIRRDAIPSDAVKLAEATHSIDQLLLRMMKQSDNRYAEALFYQIAARSGKKHAGAVEARKQLEPLVRTCGLDPADYVAADGSGLSPYNFLSARLLVALLRYAWRDSALYAHLLPTLPVAGTDGTLPSRMKRGSAAGNVRAKTGTVTGVSTLAGYADAPTGNRIAFAILMNGNQTAAKGRALQDEICHAFTSLRNP